jgi:hypothetical protein
MSRNKAPTQSSPSPPSKTEPRAASIRSQNISENRQRSEILLKIIFISSKDIAVLESGEKSDNIGDMRATGAMDVDGSDFPI